MANELDFDAINAALNRRIAARRNFPTKIMLAIVSFILVLWPWPKGE